MSQTKSIKALFPSTAHASSQIFVLYKRWHGPAYANFIKIHIPYLTKLRESYFKCVLIF